MASALSSYSRHLVHLSVFKNLLTLPLKLGLLIRSGVIMVGLISIGFVAQTTPTPEVVNGISSIMIYSPL